MERTYEIKQDVPGGDFNIHYFVDGVFETKEFYSNADGSEKREIREGYTLKQV